jgi:hypothetical protein
MSAGDMTLTFRDSTIPMEESRYQSIANCAGNGKYKVQYSHTRCRATACLFIGTLPIKCGDGHAPNPLALPHVIWSAAITAASEAIRRLTRRRSSGSFQASAAGF